MVMEKNILYITRDVNPKISSFSRKKGDNMIKIDNVSFSFPQKDLYKNISLKIEEGQHCAFLGVSGSGKSTLVDLIIDSDKYIFDGKIDKDPNIKIGYVSQFSEIDNKNELTVFNYIAEKYIKLQSQLTKLYADMEISQDMDAVLEEYQQTLDAFDAIDGNDFEMNINKTLNIANLSKLKNLTISKLSGGEFKLIQVVKEMLHSPDLLIMDEPDVFLDFENLNSLKELINAHKGTLLVITHNRFLLNHCFNNIIHLENKQLQQFDGKYIDYNFQLLQSKIELQELAHDDDEEIKRNDIMLTKLREIATNTNEAASGRTVNARAKIQERLEARRIKAPFVYIKQPKINLMTDNIIEESIALEVNNYRLAFNEVLLENVSFEIKSTNKVVIIGANGTGKTTLLKEIFEDKHDSIRLHPDIEIAYLSQIQNDMFNESNTILEEFLNDGFETKDEVITSVVSYGFDESVIDQKIGTLSGGEKNILQLAKISASNANLLLLDEPTSHLDTYSQIALEKALEEYNGAILMISHDFYSIVNSMDYVLFIEDKTIRKMTMKRFRRMIYKKHFDRDYLEMEQKKKAIETKIERALHENDFTHAKVLSEELEALIELL